MISVVIPFLNQSRLTIPLLEDISNNSILPDEIILIDNASTEPVRDMILKFTKKLNIVYIRNDKNIGVNPSWNLGISKSTSDLICVLNNDIILSSSFFESIKKTMENFKVGICVPNTIDSIEVVRNSVFTMPVYKNVRKKEGWAFTIRKNITDQIKPIPNELNRVCGDDYLFYWSKKLGFDNVKILNNYIYHYGSVTSVHELNYNVPDLKEEKMKWENIKKTYEV